MNRSFTNRPARRLQSSPRRAVTLWVIGLCCIFAKAAGQTLDAQKLAPGAQVERELSGGQAHDYRIALEAGQGIRIEVEQRGVDVVLALSGPDGKELLKENDWDEVHGTELIVWAAQAGGVYQLRIYAAEKEAAAGRYEVKVEIFPPDERFANAAQKFNEGLRLERDKKRDQSLSKFEESIELWRALGDRGMEARSLYYYASFAYRLSMLPKALDYSLRALAIFRSLGMKKEEFVALSIVSSSYSAMGEFPKALFYDRQRIPLLPVAAPADAGIALYLNLGIDSRSIGDYSKAQEYLNEALRRARDLPEKSEELLALSALATLYFVENEPMKSLEYVNAALPLSRDLKEPVREGRLLLQLGQIYARVSEPQQAISFFEQALRLTDTPEGRQVRIQALMVLGGTLEEIGNTAAALESFDQALALSRSTGAMALEMRTLARIGSILCGRGEYQKALEYQQQAIAFFHASGQSSLEADASIDLAQTYERMGHKQKARETLDQALALVRTLAGRSGEAAILRRQAFLARDDGDLKKARELMEAALRSREESRNKFASSSLKTSYGASSQNFYETYLDILARMHEQSPREGYDALALGASESARARGLLDLLAESRADIRQGADPALLEKERGLQRQLSAKDVAYHELINSSRTAVSAEAVVTEINDLTFQIQLVEAQIRASSPRYAALTQPKPLNAAEIQALLDDDTILLEFAFGEQQSWMWAVTPGALASFRLPSHQEIEAAARKFYEALTARQPKTQESSIQYATRVAEADARFQTEAFALGRTLLGPIASRLGGEWKGKRLIIVAPGVLEYLPFAALPVPPIQEAEGKGGDGYRPLIADHEIVNLPSASVLALIRRESAGRRKAAGTVAILADPVFDANDPRVTMAARKRWRAGKPGASVRSANRSSIAPAINPELMRSVRSFHRAGFSPLPFSRIEAEAISALVPRAKLLKATGFRANLSTATGGELARYRIAHFATHGLLNGEHPELSGLVLSLVDESGKAQDGFLRMQEIYNLRLPADVVVLSACQTAIGKEIKGEGLVGLTRGFMYAGAERVVASLWQVDDLATSELMKRFYRAMLTGKMRPAAALRAAQIEMMKEKRWATPYFWAGFTIQGEWR
jgi:CHAT domain-containing protein/Tfp pilus assembly protein PilF